MTCKEIQKLVDPYIDGELDLVRNLDIEYHLQDCPACTKLYRAQQNLKNALRDRSLRFEPPADLQKRIHNALRKSRPEKVKPAFSNRPWRWALLAISVAALLISSLVLIKSLVTPAANDLEIEQEVV